MKMWYHIWTKILIECSILQEGKIKYITINVHHFYRTWCAFLIWLTFECYIYFLSQSKHTTMDYKYGGIICNNLWSSWYINSKLEQMMANISTKAYSTRNLMTWHSHIWFAWTQTNSIKSHPYHLKNKIYVTLFYTLKSLLKKTSSRFQLSFLKKVKLSVHFMTFMMT